MAYDGGNLLLVRRYVLDDTNLSFGTGDMGVANCMEFSFGQSGAHAFQHNKRCGVHSRLRWHAYLGTCRGSLKRISGLSLGGVLHFLYNYIWTLYQDCIF